MRSLRNIGKHFAPYLMAGVIGLVPALAAAPAQAATTVTTGVLGTYAAGVWPFIIAMKKGIFARNGLEMDVIFVPTAPGLVQQLAAGSLDFVAGVGIVEPIHAAEKDAPVALMRVLGQSSSYELVAGKQYSNIKELKGKKIAVGGLATNDKVYLDKMMQANGFKDGDYDVVAIGATATRVPALLSGGIDAALLVPPFNFTAIGQGGKSMGLVRDFVTGLPQTGMVVATKWATAHPKEAKAINASIDEAVAWFFDPKNKDEAVSLLVEATKTSKEEVTDAYNFLVKVDFFARDSKISRKSLDGWMKALVDVKDMKAPIPVEKFLVPGLNEIVD
jgi:ABC-type nitrate/sulfonate/bicarbonate transport system substrate-binding protein